MEKQIIAVGKVIDGDVYLHVALWNDSEVTAAQLKGGRLYRAGDPRSHCLNEYERSGYDQAADTTDYEDYLADLDWLRSGC